MKSYFLIIGYIIFCIIYAICCYLIWVNRADVKAFSLFGKSIILPALIAIGLLLNELWLKPTVHENQKTNVMLIHNKGLKVADFSKIEGVGRLDYHIPNSVLDLWKSTYDKEDGYQIEKENIDEFFIDLVVASFFNWVADKYIQNWDSSFQDRLDLFIGEMYSIKKSEDAEANQLELSWDTLKKIIHDNDFLQVGPIYFDKIYLPSGSKIKYIRNKRKRKILINTRYLTLNISVAPTGGQDLEASELGKKIKPLLGLPISSNYTSAANFQVSFSFKVNPWYRWAHSAKKQLRWARDLSRGFSKSFDWQMIWKRFEKIGLVPPRY